MGTFPELLRFRAGLLDDAYRLPGLLEAPKAPPVQQLQHQTLPVASQAPQNATGGGVGGAMGSIFGGMDDPRLTPEQNAEARRQAMLQAGLAILASPESGLRAIAEGGLFGQQAGAQAREVQYGRTQQERIQNALNDPEILALLTPGQRKLAAMLPPEDVTKLIASVVMAGPGETKNIGDPGDWIQGPDGSIMQLGGATPDAMSDAAMKTALVENGLTEQTVQQAPPGVKERVIARANEIRGANAPKGPTINVSTGQKVADKQYEKAQDDADNATVMIQTLGAMESLLTDNPQLSGVVEDATMGLRGVGVSLGLLSQEQAEKLDAQQVLKSLSNKVVLGSAEELTGPKSDNDIKFLKEIWPNMRNTPEGNILLIRYLRAVEERKIEKADAADRWASTHDGSMVGFRSAWTDRVKANPISIAALAPAAPKGTLDRPRVFRGVMPN